jgi:hypothetical protein
MAPRLPPQNHRPPVQTLHHSISVLRHAHRQPAHHRRRRRRRLLPHARPRNALPAALPPAPAPTPPRLGVLARPPRPQARPGHDPPLARDGARLRGAPRAARARRRRARVLGGLQQLRPRRPAAARLGAPVPPRREARVGGPAQRARGRVDVSRAEGAGGRVLEGGGSVGCGGDAAGVRRERADE